MCDYESPYKGNPTAQQRALVPGNNAPPPPRCLPNVSVTALEIEADGAILSCSAAFSAAVPVPAGNLGVVGQHPVRLCRIGKRRAEKKSLGHWENGYTAYARSIETALYPLLAWGLLHPQDSWRMCWLLGRSKGLCA